MIVCMDSDFPWWLLEDALVVLITSIPLALFRIWLERTFEERRRTEVDGHEAEEAADEGADQKKEQDDKGHVSIMVKAGATLDGLAALDQAHKAISEARRTLAEMADEDAE